MTAPLISRQPLLITLGAMLSLLPATSAQVLFDVSPYAGFYLPLGSMFVWTGPQPYGDQWGNGSTVALQKASAFGSHLTVWPVERFGIEATIGYAPSGVTWRCRVGGCGDGHAVTASAKAVALIGGPSRRSFYLGGGVGGVALGGYAYEGVAGTTSVAGTMGAGVELMAASAAPVRIEAEVYLFRPPFRLETCNASNAVCRLLVPSWKQQFQHAVILSIGWVFGRHLFQKSQSSRDCKSS